MEQEMFDEVKGVADVEDDDTDIGDSPCPPPTRGHGVAFKGGKMSRMPLARAETYGPSSRLLGH